VCACIVLSPPPQRTLLVRGSAVHHTTPPARKTHARRVATKAPCRRRRRTQWRTRALRATNLCTQAHTTRHYTHLRPLAPPPLYPLLLQSTLNASVVRPEPPSLPRSARLGALASPARPFPTHCWAHTLAGHLSKMVGAVGRQTGLLLLVMAGHLGPQNSLHTPPTASYCPAGAQV
jgi:hypothetical protein